MNIETYWKFSSSSRASSFESRDERSVRIYDWGLGAESVWKIISRVL